MSCTSSNITLPPLRSILPSNCTLGLPQPGRLRHELPTSKIRTTFFTYQNDHIAAALEPTTSPTTAVPTMPIDDHKIKSTRLRPSTEDKLEPMVLIQNTSDIEKSTDISSRVQGMRWHQKMQLSDDIWAETCKLFLDVRRKKELRNRSPNRKCVHMLASILYILCRKNNNPRTFAEICTAAGIKKQEIGVYYRIMLKLLKPAGLVSGRSTGLRAHDVADFMIRWCTKLELPEKVASAAIHVFQRASEMNITDGKCPISVGAASIYLCCQGWVEDCNTMPYIHSFATKHTHIWRDQKDIAVAAGVVPATLTGCYRSLCQHRSQLLPKSYLRFVNYLAENEL